MRLFCFHHAGGGSALFRDWQAALGPYADVVPVVLPGREHRCGQRRLTDVEHLVALLDDELDDATPNVFFGHSMGALVAYRLAALRHDRGAPTPRALVLSGYAPPHLPTPLPPVAALDDAALAHLLNQIGGLPSEVLAWHSMSIEVLALARDDLAVCASAHTSSIQALDIPIHAIAGDADPIVGELDLAEWADYTTSTFRLTLVGGDHFYLSPPPTELLVLLRNACASG